jgi:DUF4097 and DUF4098 domain-containing protein YvlB
MREMRRIDSLHVESAVMMNVLRCSTCLLLCSIAGSAAYAGEDVDENHSASATGNVRIHSTRGELKVIAWDRAEVQVSGELDDLAEGLQFVVNGEDTLIRVEMPESDVNWGDGSDLVIHVPVDSRVSVEGVSTDVKLTGVQGAIAVRTASGDVRARKFGAATHINTMSGNIDLSGGSGWVKVVTTSGNTEIELEASNVSVDTVTGDVELELGGFDALLVRSISGDLELQGSLNPSGRIETSTVEADIELSLVEPVNAVLEVQVGAGGDIDNDLSEDQPRKLISEKRSLSATLGDGSGLIRLYTVKGDVTLESD